MLKNYFKIIWRTIYRQPVYAILNLSCLTVGLTAAILILLYLDFEINFDRFHEKSDRIYRVETNSIKTKEKTIEVNWINTSALLGPYVKQDFPAVEAYTRLFRFFHNEVVEFEVDGKSIEEEHIALADTGVLEVFTFDFIHGDPQEALTGPNKIILAQSLAQRIFGDTNPMGKIMKSNLAHVLPDVEPDFEFIVSGVYRDFPRNSHRRLNALISAESDPKLSEYYFRRFTFATYVLLHKEADAEALEKDISSIYGKYMDPDIEMFMEEAVHELVPLREIHMNQTGGAAYVYVFAAVGFLLLLIAIISYVNLVTAQASKRALEVGVRKVMGSSRTQLVVQFLSESLVFSTIALTLAVALVFSTIDPLNELLSLELSAQLLGKSSMIGGLFLLLFLLTFLGGAYPAFFLSSFQPISILKGKTSKGAPLRRGLLAVQFAIVIFVLITTGMIYEQLQFLRQKDLGFNQDQIIRLGLETDEVLEKLPVLTSALKQSPLIAKVGSATFLPGTGLPRRPISTDGGPDQESQFVFFGSIDYDFLETLDMHLVAGRNYSPDHPEDEEKNIIVNEALAKSFGLENPVGEKVRFGDKRNPSHVTIIGVVKDFHHTTLHDPIGSQMYMLAPASYHLAIKIDQNIPAGIAHIEKSWKQIFPNEPFKYHFLDADIQAGYEVDQIRGNIFLLFSCLTIFITFLGLFGLVAYIARQRIREIGIRKVLGAGIWDIVLLMSKDFLLLVSFAALPAFAIAWYFINNWLQDFAYRAEMNYLIYGLVLLLMLLLTFLITSVHAARTTNLNPADTLKYE